MNLCQGKEIEESNFKNDANNPDRSRKYQAEFPGLAYVESLQLIDIP